jgi:hypothetical protein
MFVASTVIARAMRAALELADVTITVGKMTAVAALRPG